MTKEKNTLKEILKMRNVAKENAKKINAINKRWEKAIEKVIPGFSSLEIDPKSLSLLLDDELMEQFEDEKHLLHLLPSNFSANKLISLLQMMATKPTGSGSSRTTVKNKKDKKLDPAFLMMMMSHGGKIDPMTLMLMKGQIDLPTLMMMNGEIDLPSLMTANKENLPSLMMLAGREDGLLASLFLHNKMKKSSEKKSDKFPFDFMN
ncbi:MAG: hypothetical protein ACRC5M_04770 [Anaeroplasmataceae bacterium]